MKKYYIVLDTETTGDITYPIAYNWGWIVTDRNGQIYKKRSYLIKELWIDNFNFVKECYYKDKLPLYFLEVADGTTEIKSLEEIAEIFISDFKEYNAPRIGAYNMAFDKRAIANTFSYIGNSSWNGFNEKYIFCIMNLAGQVLMNRPTYYHFARDNGLFTEKGNLKTSAEACYKYITGQTDFSERHMALQDCEIETAILAKCLRQRKKMDWSKFSPVWNKVKKGYTEYAEKKGWAD